MQSGKIQVLFLMITNSKSFWERVLIVKCIFVKIKIRLKGLQSKFWRRDSLSLVCWAGKSRRSKWFIVSIILLSFIFTNILKTKTVSTSSWNTAKAALCKLQSIKRLMITTNLLTNKFVLSSDNYSYLPATCTQMNFVTDLWTLRISCSWMSQLIKCTHA